MFTINKFTLSMFALLAMIFITSCEKDDDDSTSGDVQVEFDYQFGSAGLPWDLNTPLRHPRTGDTLSFTQLSFYVSNVRLKHGDGTWWSEPESYHLVRAKTVDEGSFIIKDVPAGNYTEMEYTLGVDSTRNVSGAQTGALSPANGMFWSWNSGYIMLKAEGNSPQSSDGSFAFHLGGFSGENSIVTPKSFLFGSNELEVGEVMSSVVFVANPARLWHSSPSVGDRNKMHMPGPEAKAMATDFFSNVAFLEIR